MFPKEILFLLLNLYVTVLCMQRLTCLQCHRAVTEENCDEIGKLDKCHINDVCFTEWRNENGLQIIKKGCKQRTACVTLSRHNSVQCHPDRSPSVCRYCCDHEKCNLLAYHTQIVSSPTTLMQTVTSPPLGKRSETDNNCEVFVPDDIPRDLQPKKVCQINVPKECIDQGTMVFHIAKLSNKTERLVGLNDREEKRKEGKCTKPPKIVTTVVYEDEDSYVMLSKLIYRFPNGLATQDSPLHFVNDVPLRTFLRRERERQRLLKDAFP